MKDSFKPLWKETSVNGSTKRFSKFRNELCIVENIFRHIGSLWAKRHLPCTSKWLIFGRHIGFRHIGFLKHIVVNRNEFSTLENPTKDSLQAISAHNLRPTYRNRKYLSSILEKMAAGGHFWEEYSETCVVVFLP